jgi:DHA2 family multidrug resistance protein-like MFS transporter
MVLLLVLGPMLLPEYRDPRAGRPDLLSTVLSLSSVLLLIYGLKEIAQDGVQTLPALSLAAGLSVGAAFAYRQTRLADPLIDLRLFRVPAFSASLVVYMIGGIVMFGAFVFIAQFLQLGLGLTPLEAGLLTMPWAAPAPARKCIRTPRAEPASRGRAAPRFRAA